MSNRKKVLLIDGSNAVCAIFGSWPGTREDQNRSASDFLVRLSAWASAQKETEVEIVFDGGFRSLGGKTPDSAMRVLFSNHETADALIVERARALRFYGRKVTVVTWDRGLAEDARAEEAKIMDPQRLWELIR